jgi:ABC-type microcin C transport system permease subunit YejB
VFAFVLRRLALLVPTFIGVTLIAFALIHLIPGDPVENISGERGMDPAHDCSTSSGSTAPCPCSTATTWRTSCAGTSACR